MNESPDIAVRAAGTSLIGGPLCETQRFIRGICEKLNQVRTSQITLSFSLISQSFIYRFDDSAISEIISL
jgi:hypothetical protein